jgi:hypothetical protein
MVICMPILKFSMQFIYNFVFFEFYLNNLVWKFINFEGSQLIVLVCGSKVKI